MELTLVKQLDNRFTLAFDDDYDKAKKLKPGKLLKCKVSQPRNQRFLAKYFVLIKMVFDNQEIYSNTDHLRTDLQVEAGYYDTIQYARRASKRTEIHQFWINE